MKLDFKEIDIKRDYIASLYPNKEIYTTHKRYTMYRGGRVYNLYVNVFKEVYNRLYTHIQ